MKRRILFVEDDPLLLEMYTMMLDDEPDWHVVTVNGAKEALELMEKSPFDIVVSDLMMPDMNGLEFVNEVRTRYPRASRIIVSVLSDQERVARCLEATHQFIGKPFNVRLLKATLKRVCSLDAYLADGKVKVLVNQLGTLPSFPSIYVEVMKELGSLDTSIDAIASIVAKDPGMTAKLLQIVNSAAVGLPRKVTSPFEAVQFLGLGMVRSLVLSAHIFSCFERTNLRGFSVDRLWNHAANTGVIARMILQSKGAEAAEAEDACVAGMLHDGGKLMLANSLHEEYQRALARAVDERIPLHEAETEVFGATHAGAMAYLLGLWGLPATIVEAVAFHHEPRRSEFRTVGPLTAVHIANVLEHEVSDPKSGPVAGAAQLDMGYIESLGLKNRIEGWRQEAARLLGAKKLE